MTNQQRRRLLKTIGGTAVIGTVAGCLGGDDTDDDEDETEDETDDEPETTEEDDAGLRVAHLSPDAPNVDVYVDDEGVLEDVPFRDVSEYLDLEPDEYEIMVTAAGDEETVVFDETVPVDEGDYTAAAIGELAEENQLFEVTLFEDDLSDPGDDARVRVIHAAPDAPDVDATVEESGDAIVEDLAFGDATTTEVSEGSYTVEVRPATEDNDGDVVETFPIEVEAGTVYSVFAVGYLDPAGAPADEAFDLEIIEDDAE